MHASNSRAIYHTTFGLLLVLLAVTVAVAHVNLGAWSPLVAMTVAVVKAVLIVLYFMHVRHEVALVRVFAVAGFVWLGVMFVFLFSDYLTRIRFFTGQ